MPTAARSPAATASTTDEGPLTASPPAKTHLCEVWPVTGSATSNPAAAAFEDQLRRRTAAVRAFWPIATRTWSAGIDERFTAFFGPAAARAVELAQPHRLAADAHHVAVFHDHSRGRRQQLQLDPLVQRLFDFLFVGGHHLAAAAIDHRRLLGAQPNGRAGRIDGGVAAADDDHVLADADGAAEVVDPEETQRVGNPRGVVAGDSQSHSLRRTDARGRPPRSLRRAAT